MKQHVQGLVENAQVPIGYTVAGITGSAPIWLDQLTGWLQLVAVIVAIVVGISTYKLNQIKIKEIKNKSDTD